MNSNVWIVNDGGHDFTDAAKYGKLVSLTTGNINVFNVDRLQCSLAKALDIYKPADFLLLTGSTIINVLAVGIVLKQHGFAQILLYNAKDRNYIPRTITTHKTKKEVKTFETSNDTPRGGGEGFFEYFSLRCPESRKDRIRGNSTVSFVS
jgi:hypothetical protein